MRAERRASGESRIAVFIVVSGQGERVCAGGWTRVIKWGTAGLVETGVFSAVARRSRSGSRCFGSGAGPQRPWAFAEQPKILDGLTLGAQRLHATPEATDDQEHRSQTSTTPSHPENMIRSEAHAKILDFGMAKARPVDVTSKLAGWVFLLPRPCRLVAFACAMAGLLCFSSQGRADDEAKKTCASAFASGQRLMRSGRLLEARKMLVLCGGPQCPAVMHPDCQQWLDSVEASTPTVVFQVSAAKSDPPGDIKVAVDDGESMAFDGRALPMDPGTHEVTFVADGFAPAHRRMVVSEGEKLHRETIELVPVRQVADGRSSLPAAEAVPASHRGRVTTGVVIASAVGVAAGTAAVILGLKARADDRGLDQCKPNCTQERVSQIRSEYLWTNLSIGLAVTGVATATVLLLLHGDSAKTPARMALGVDVRANALAPTLTGRF